MAKQSRARARPPAPRPRRGHPEASPASSGGPVQPQDTGETKKTPSFSEAVLLYERGLKLLQRHDFAAAAEKFREVLGRFPEEREIHDRATLFLKVCDRELQPRQRTPDTLEERVYAATIDLNAGRNDSAFALLSRACAEAPDNGHVHYMLAVVHARRGERDLALEHLRQATQLDPEVRLLARRDADFEDLHDDGDFSRITERPPASGRRRLRPRSTR